MSLVSRSFEPGHHFPDKLKAETDITKQPEIQRELDDLFTEIDRLGNVKQDLLGRLGPVLAQLPQTDVAATRDDETTTSEIGNKIRAARRMLAEIRDDMRVTLKRLEV